MSKPLCCLPTDKYNLQQFFRKFHTFSMNKTTNWFFLFFALPQFIDARRKWNRDFRFPSWNCSADVIDHQHLLLEQRNFPSWIDLQLVWCKYFRKRLAPSILFFFHPVPFHFRFHCGSFMSHELACKNTWTLKIMHLLSELHGKNLQFVVTHLNFAFFRIYIDWIFSLDNWLNFAYFFFLQLFCIGSWQNPLWITHRSIETRQRQRVVH